MPNVYKTRFLDTQYVMCMEGDIIKISDSAVLVDKDFDITMKEKEFRGSGRLWELLTRKRVHKDHVT